MVSPTLPKTEIYKDVNVIQIDDWNNNAANVVIDLLEDENKLAKIKEGIEEDWNRIFSPQAAAKRILDKLK